MEEWKSVEPGIWKPQEEGDSITGVLLAKEPADKENNMSAKYRLENQEGFWLVWGCATLDERLSLVELGSKVKITYKGKKELGKGKTLNIYRVDVAVESKEPEVSEEQVKEEPNLTPSSTVTQTQPPQ